MKYVLDTNALSGLMRGHPALLARLRASARADVALPQPVVAEIHYGLERLPRSKKRQLLEQRFDLFARELPRASWTEQVSLEFGRLKAQLERRGRTIPDFDLAIAAHALAEEAVLVTADNHHMARIPDLTIEDWSR